MLCRDGPLRNTDVDVRRVATDDREHLAGDDELHQYIGRTPETDLRAVAQHESQLLTRHANPLHATAETGGTSLSERAGGRDESPRNLTADADRRVPAEPQ